MAKLRRAKLSVGSEKQFGDALRIYEVQHRALDMACSAERVEKLELNELRARLQVVAEPI